MYDNWEDLEASIINCQMYYNNIIMHYNNIQWDITVTMEEVKNV